MKDGVLFEIENGDSITDRREEEVLLVVENDVTILVDATTKVV